MVAFSCPVAFRDTQGPLDPDLHRDEESGPFRATAHLARGAAALGDGRHHAAFRHRLWGVFGQSDQAFHRFMPPSALLDLVEAAGKQKTRQTSSTNSRRVAARSDDDVAQHGKLAATAKCVPIYGPPIGRVQWATNGYAYDGVGNGHVQSAFGFSHFNRHHFHPYSNQQGQVGLVERLSSIRLMSRNGGYVSCFRVAPRLGAQPPNCGGGVGTLGPGAILELRQD
jgi:hypothetical protein